MKTVLIIAALAASLNVFAGNRSDEPVYNDFYNANSLLSARTVYSNADGEKQPCRIFIYSYDDNNRIVKKEAERWDAQKSCWLPDYQLLYSYEGNAFAVDYAGWNERTKKFDKNSERSAYLPGANDQTMKYYKYKRNADNTWKLTEQYDNLDCSSTSIMIAEMNKR